MDAARRLLTLIAAAALAPACICTDLTAFDPLPGDVAGLDGSGGAGPDAAPGDDPGRDAAGGDPTAPDADVDPAADADAGADSCGGGTCPPGTRCDHGECACPSGTLCTGECVDTRRDPLHCGGCEQRCPEDEDCHSGRCRD